MLATRPYAGNHVWDAINDLRSEKVKEFARLMYQAALEVAERRGWKHASEVTLFVPQYVVAEQVGVDPSTIRRWYYRYPILRHLVVYREHKTTLTLDGKELTRNDGCMWSIRLSPTLCRKARVVYEALKEQPRNLGADIRAGRTMHGSERPLQGKNPLQAILYWCGFKPPVGNDPCNVAEAVQDAELDHETIGQGATLIVSRLRDHGGFRYWCKQLWKVHRGQLRPQVLVDQVNRASSALEEGFARKAGAMAATWLA